MSMLQSPKHAQWTLPMLLREWWPEAPQLPVSGLSIDSRTVQRGDLFLALRGEAHDGRRYVAQAAAAGAVAALIEDAPLVTEAGIPLHAVPGLRQHVGEIASRFYGYPSRALHIAAVTGTNGKTTVSQLLAQLIRAAGYDCGVMGTLGASLDGRPSSSTHTTPDAVTVHATLAEWVAAAVPFATMEVSSHALDQGRVGAVEFDTAIFTNLTRDHLDYHGDMQAYGEAKMRLFEFPALRTAILNADDPFCAQLSARLADDVNCIRYSIGGAEAELRLSSLEFDKRGLRARLHSPWGSATLRSPLLGAFNASNLAAVLAAALTAGLPLEATVRAVATLTPVPGRMEPLPRQDNAPLVVVDYAHTPDALRQVLTALRPQVPGRLIAVFGCGGDRDRGKRADMAACASELADVSFVTSDNPRSEDPQAIIDDITAGMSGDYRTVLDRAAAIAEAVAFARADDCVLIAGKGHEDYQIIGEQRLPFSDVEQARLALAERSA